MTKYCIQISVKKQQKQDKIRRANLKIPGIEEQVEVNSKDTDYLFTEIRAENYPNLEKEMDIQNILGVVELQLNVTREKPLHDILQT